jgi:hypothetical protein
LSRFLGEVFACGVSLAYQVLTETGWQTQTPHTIDRVALPHLGEQNEVMLRRFALQNGARHLLENKRLSGCTRWLTYGESGVELRSYPALNKAKFSGLQTCSSVWMCPVCAAKITERRRSLELAPALVLARAQGLHVYMVTYTLRHNHSDRLGDLLDGLRKARKASRSGAAYVRIAARHGIVGSIRALEVTHGANGWHPHIHELLFLDVAPDRVGLVADLRAQWDRGLAKAGLKAVNSHGCDVAETYKHVEEYVAKYGKEPKWGVAEEMSKQPVKKARDKSGKSAFQLLSDFTFEGDLKAGALFVEYAQVLHGSRQLYWSPGLKKRFGVDDLTDEQIEAMEETEKGCVVLDRLSESEWRCIAADDMRGQLWNVVAAGDSRALEDFLAPYRSTRTNNPVTVTQGLSLIDWTADERDRQVAEKDPFDGDWMVTQIGGGVTCSMAAAKASARRLYARQAERGDVFYFAEKGKRRRQVKQQIDALMPWRVVHRGRKSWVIERNVTAAGSTCRHYETGSLDLAAK